MILAIVVIVNIIAFFLVGHFLRKEARLWKDTAEIWEDTAGKYKELADLKGKRIAILEGRIEYLHEVARTEGYARQNIAP
jgi:hypothetical protein